MTEEKFEDILDDIQNFLQKNYFPNIAAVDCSVIAEGIGEVLKTHLEIKNEE